MTGKLRRADNACVAAERSRHDRGDARLLGGKNIAADDFVQRVGESVLLFADAAAQRHNMRPENTDEAAETYGKTGNIVADDTRGNGVSHLGAVKSRFAADCVNAVWT